jgi:hypothetical protein
MQGRLFLDAQMMPQRAVPYPTAGFSGPVSQITEPQPLSSRFESNAVILLPRPSMGPVPISEAHR